MNLDLSLLACLEAVVTEGSFEKAAGVLARQASTPRRLNMFKNACTLPTP